METLLPLTARADAEGDAVFLSITSRGFAYVYQVGPGDFLVTNYHTAKGILVARFFRGESCSELVEKVETSLSRQRADNSSGNLRLAFEEATTEMGIPANGRLFNELWAWLNGN